MLIFEIKSKVKLPSRRINQGPLHFRGKDAAKYNGTLMTYFQTKPGQKGKKKNIKNTQFSGLPPVE